MLFFPPHNLILGFQAGGMSLSTHVGLQHRLKRPSLSMEDNFVQLGKHIVDYLWAKDLVEFLNEDHFLFLFSLIYCKVDVNHAIDKE